jgi:diguanylate cyclase (GGDEF)-like protein
MASFRLSLARFTGRAAHLVPGGRSLGPTTPALIFIVLLSASAVPSASGILWWARLVAAFASAGVATWWLQSYLGSHDLLTRLPARSRFEREIGRAQARSRRDGSGIAVLYLDLDDFETVNSEFGYAAGDELLGEVAVRLQSAVRRTGIAARMWADSFAVLVEEVVSPADVEAVAERILASLIPPFKVGGLDRAIRCSVGIAVSPHAEESSTELLRMAEVALHAAKSNGKGRWDLFEESVHGTALKNIRMRADLQRALDEDELLLYFQPIYLLESGRLAGVEALVRWQHPERGLVAPLEFIPFAEESGQILPIGQWVLQQACRHVGAWQKIHSTDPPLFISVNLSPRQLLDPDLTTYVEEGLRNGGLEGSSLVLEITETMIMKDVPGTSKALHDLKRYGVRIALDDFGAGYSSLMYLQDLPVDILKVDKSFVDGIGAAGDEPGLTGAIITLSHSLGLETIAEGIEERDQLLHLRALGCEMGQGFHFARPAAPEGIAELLGTSLPVAV